MELLGNYCAYLRKSRKDMMLEQMGEGDTLIRHEAVLNELSKNLKIIISKTYREIQSGETIASRPVMQQLLTDVEDGMWDGVLVVEVERLARGDTIDQGIVSQVFKYSNTKIITPLKTYYPENESDEEYFEFGLFMSRREYKKINQRMNNGRIASVKEGKFVGNKPPYGYERVKLDNEKGFSLVENKEEAEVVRIMFDMYAKGNSYTDIVKLLNGYGYKPRCVEKWGEATVRGMLANPVYTGKMKWKARKQVKTIKDGQIRISRPVNKGEDLILTQGRHTPIISPDIWEKVEARRKEHTPKVPLNRTLQNPLAGLVICGKCGEIMQRRPYTGKPAETQLICKNRECDNIASKLRIVEYKILEALEDWLGDYSVEYSKNKKEFDSEKRLLERAIKNLEKEIAKEQKKLSNICNFYEEGTYTKELYLERSKVVIATIKRLEDELEPLHDKLKQCEKDSQYKEELLPKVIKAIELYQSNISIEDKNLLLKTVLERIEYIKTTRTFKRNGNADDTNFELRLYPKIENKA